jgi:tetratricopeptide (TPR) repeat protein
MPFINPDQNTKNTSLSENTLTFFIGREYERDFFLQSVLVPEKPICNVISISGNGGVGKSTLLARFINQARTDDFKGYCVVAQVNERQTDPVRVMEHLAEQLRLTGDFEKSLIRYKEALRKLHDEDEAKQEAALRKVTTEVAGEAVKAVPVVGPILEKVTGPTIERIFDGFHEHQLLKEAERLEDPLRDLTKAFVKELNALANAQVQVETTGTRRRRRILLFFDTFEKLALVTSAWLLDYLLESEISTNVVLVIAGRDPLEQSPPHDPKKWLPYRDAGVIRSISLGCFTFDETRAYLAAKEITDTRTIETIYHLSQGLPLYLSLLTSSGEGNIDPTKSVIDNFLRWIPDQEQIKRRLALDAALFSKAFNLDDLVVFSYIAEQEREALYLWLAGQPFISRDIQNGQYRYHELAQDLFSRHLFQRSPKEYRETRKTFASYYQTMLDQMKAESGEEAYGTDEWIELALALIHQLFFLTDESSLISAVRWIFDVYEYSGQLGNIVWVLSELLEEQRIPQMSVTARQMANDLFEYFSFNWESPVFMEAANRILEKVAQHVSFPPKLLARIFRNRGKAHRQLGEYQQAIDDFNQAIALDPEYTWAYVSRGTAYRLLEKYQQAIDDFNQAVALDSEYAWAYASRGIAYRLLDEYQRAIDDFTCALTLKPNYAWVSILRGEAYLRTKQYKQAIDDFNYALSLDSQAVEVYCLRGIARVNLQEYRGAIDDFDHALKLDPSSTWVSEHRRAARNAFMGAQKTQKNLSEIPYVAGHSPLWTKQHDSSAPDKKKKG